ncbi:hypothetical protein EYF80_008851 [Liparis tanakae]|uniref:Uncharacterized protein n=1 Tax=Liparis tanakae TaxID=230148 RepID=A0A4Z2ISM0_9TELE|nr:hypothetical protein EYF80_008851 [Liparis tanakae]
MWCGDNSKKVTCTPVVTFFTPHEFAALSPVSCFTASDNALSRVKPGGLDTNAAALKLPLSCRRAQISSKIQRHAEAERRYGGGRGRGSNQPPLKAVGNLDVER